MKLRHKLLLAFAAVHLALVGFGAANAKLPLTTNAVGDTISLYSALSGADNGYGFFAPGVGNQFRTRFIMRDHSGREWTETLALGGTSEANLRFSGLSNLIPTLPDEEISNVLRSLAATMLGKHPNAKTVTIQLDMYGFDRSATDADFPTMREFRNGVRPRWLPVIQGTFTRKEI